MKGKNIILCLACILALSLLANYVLLKSGNTEAPKPALSGRERYIYISSTNDYDLIESDTKGMQKFAQEFGVDVEILSPKHFDSVEQAGLLTEAIVSKPAGILISAWDPSLIPIVNQAVDAGIPTITIETDLPESKRLAYVGIDWYQFGVRQADALAQMIGERGTVAVLGVIGANGTDQGFAGFAYGISRYEQIYMLEGYDDMGTAEEAERITKQILEDNSVSGIAGFDTNSGIGISRAVQEMGKEDQVKVTCVGMTPAHLKYLKDGTVQLLFGFLREQFTYYGCRLLYDHNHNGLHITSEDDKNGITKIPQMIATEFIEINKNNLNDYMN